MAQIDVHDLSGKVVGQVELPDAIFDGEVKLHLIHQMVKAQLAARRAGTHSTLTRSEVHGTNAKPWRQKGTGRARAGDVKSPVWRHGGTVFGPKPRSYEQKVNRKVRRTALKSALNLRLKEGRLKVVADFDLPEAKTRLMTGALRSLQAQGKTLMVTEADRPNFLLSVRNIPDAKPIRVEGLNVYDIMWHETIVCTKGAIEAIAERLAG
ncbi:MAG: 50S ribosomal protein L4 [Candidatus Tectomicrobia bacterium RIFCSPLOWO2_12_FULL_69_37]|nr:MAG: 50S ribosomal protein L4 [Candidatus Tectomicrobia bacterium RIFCSPLOWO2_12_FULL_69_37]